MYPCDQRFQSGFHTSNVYLIYKIQKYELPIQLYSICLDIIQNNKFNLLYGKLTTARDVTLRVL